MQYQFIVTTLIAAALANPAFAANTSASKEEKIGVGTGAVIGAIAGGPVGLIIGAAVGAKIGDEFDQRNDEIDRLDASLANSTSRANGLQRDVDKLNASIDRMSADLQQAQQYARPEFLALLQAGIETDLLFRTDESVLSDSTDGRLQQLAGRLAGMPDVHIRLDGFADERGDEVYNQALSARRVEYVRDLLVSSGVDPSRINLAAHGESPAAEKTVDSFALQRRVSLKLYVDEVPSFAANPDNN